MTIDYAKEYISQREYQVLDDNSEDGHIAFRYQISTVHLWVTSTENDFFVLTLPNFVDVTDDNIDHVKEICHHVNKEGKQVKLFVLNDVIIASAELYYLTKSDFNYQMTKALRNLVAAKVAYKKTYKSMEQ